MSISYLLLHLVFGQICAANQIIPSHCHHLAKLEYDQKHLPGRYVTTLAPNFGNLRDLRANPKLKAVAINPLFLFEKGVQYKRNPKTGLKERVPFTGVFERKPAQHVRHIILSLQDMNADILIMPEVENEGAMDLLVEQLKIDYQTVFYPGNTNQMGIGFFIKRDLPFMIDVWSHDHLAFKGKIFGQQASYDPVFSRDAGLAMLRLVNQSTGEVYPQASSPLAFLSLHKKSMRSGKNDPRSEKKSFAESTVLNQIYHQIKRAYPEIALWMGGDFNRFFQPLDRTLLPLFKGTDLAEGFIHLKQRGHPGGNDPYRTTHYYFEKDGSKSFHQLDAWVMNLAAQQLLDLSRPSPIEVYRFRKMEENSLSAELLPDPTSHQQREKQRPSDHNPIIVHIDMTSWLNRWQPKIIVP